ncbi:MAG: tetratricopeptide repeat protein [Kofleriaceae bacterium]|nr:MAG: tetratricopeptide repeat protein [Kofleriaceae bacterium]MBZ0231876.1 suppressor of fused domain protein [Kofleriaceae bacterium]
MTLAAADQLTAEGSALFQQHEYAAAMARFERAVAIYPSHHQAWKGLGHCLLCLARPQDAARAFDKAIGLRPDSATALWGGALAHADLGHRIVAQNYLKRVLALQPTWVELALSVPALASFLQLSAKAGDLLRVALGAYSARTYRHATDASRAIDVARFADEPEHGLVTYASLGLSNVEWPDGRPRLEVLLATAQDSAAAPWIVANAVFHVMDSGFYPAPGTMVRDLVAVINAGELSRRLPHAYFTVPKRWGLRLPLDEGPPAITLTMVVPVSEAEYQYWKAHGDQALEARFAGATMEPADLKRASVV